MKLIFGEFKPNYESYHFPYQVWLLKEAGDEAERIFNAGFLPVRSLPGVYYLSRSLRVNLSQFEPTSENRRVAGKNENMETDLKPLADFGYTSSVQKFCKDYAKERFGKGVLPAAGIRSIFKGRVYNQVFVFKDKDKQKDVGYAVGYSDSRILQYAHAFYDLDYFDQSLGAFMMFKAVSWAKENNKDYAYLGTCYDQSAWYKTEFKGVEFFNGFSWSTNLKELKALLQRKGDQYLLKDKEYLENFHEGNLHRLLDNNGIRVRF